MRPSKYNHCRKCGAYHGSDYDCVAMKTQRELATAMKPASEMFRSVGTEVLRKQDEINRNVFEREIWNKAIEEAASILEADPVCKPQAETVRRLKK